jgi:hypothetical protein
MLAQEGEGQEVSRDVEMQVRVFLKPMEGIQGGVA